MFFLPLHDLFNASSILESKCAPSVAPGLGIIGISLHFSLFYLLLALSIYLSFQYFIKGMSYLFRLFPLSRNFSSLSCFSFNIPFTISQTHLLFRSLSPHLSRKYLSFYLYLHFCLYLTKSNITCSSISSSLL